MSAQPLQWATYAGRRHLFDRSTQGHPICGSEGDFGMEGTNAVPCPVCVAHLFRALDKAWG
jgi:hypothetical protein